MEKSLTEKTEFTKACNEYCDADNSDTQNLDEWTVRNYDAILNFVQQNDMSIFDMNISAKAFNALRINDFLLLSQFVLKTIAEIYEISFDNRSVAEEIYLYAREWLFANRDKISSLPTVKAEPQNIKSYTQPENCGSDTADSYLSDVQQELIGKKEAYIRYIKQHDIPIVKLNLSGRSFRALKRSGINMLSEVAALYPDGYYKIRNLGDKSVEEIKNCVEQYILNNAGNFEEDSIDVSYDNEKTELKSETKQLDIPIEKLNLSARSFKALKRSGINMLSEVVALYPDGYYKIRNLGDKSVEEIKNCVERYSLNTSNIFKEDLTAADNAQPKDFDVNFISALQLFQNSQTKDKAWEYIRKLDIDIREINFSNRSHNALLKAGITKFSMLLESYLSGISSLKNLGEKSVNEIESIVITRLEKLKPNIIAFCNGDTQALFSDEYITDTILKQFDNKEFTGLSYKEIKEVFSDDVDDNRIKKAIGFLIHSGKLEYVDFRCYRVYPAFFDVLNKASETQDSNRNSFLLRRYNGETLEEIGQSAGITRERVRQLCNKQYNEVKHNYYCETGLRYFDEDYYAYLYSNYDVTKELLSIYLNLSETTLGYLKNTYTTGKAALETALSDSKLDLNLRLRIRDFLNRNKVLIDDVLLEQNRHSIEEYVLEHYCKNETKYSDFIKIYNDVLIKNNITNPKLLFTDEFGERHHNPLMDCKKCLWKQGELLRYYDIDSRDYTELLETINLEEYSNIEISTLKFIEDYPEIMEKYDIRDHYELHNLLKKTIGNDNDLENDVHFNRQPVIAFGQSDRVELYKKILNIVSPVTADEFAEYIHLENGFDKLTLLSSPEIQQFSKYYHNGVYSVNFKQLPEYHATMLSALLENDFYYIDEIIKIYENNFADADTECINPRTLKSIGFNVFSKYAIKNYPTAESYFRALLTKDDIFDSVPYNSRYGTVAMYKQTALELRQKHEIFMFENEQYINLRRLSKAGITKQMIEDFCSEVNDIVPPNAYFTIQSLRQYGFSHELDNLGFSDIFYAGILAVSPLFSCQKFYGNIVLYSGKNKSVLKSLFIQSVLEEYSCVDMDEFIDDVYEKYGIRIPSKYEVIGALADTEMYYDSIMDKIYANKELYYSDLDD